MENFKGSVTDRRVTVRENTIFHGNVDFAKVIAARRRNNIIYKYAYRIGMTVGFTENISHYVVIYEHGNSRCACTSSLYIIYMYSTYATEIFASLYFFFLTRWHYFSVYFTVYQAYGNSHEINFSANEYNVGNIQFRPGVPAPAGFFGTGPFYLKYRTIKTQPKPYTGKLREI